MSSFLAWLGAAPSGAVAVVTSALAAVVALLVVVLTQWILGRRARTELLTEKLEDLYLALNELSSHSVRRVEEALRNSEERYFPTPGQLKAKVAFHLSARKALAGRAREVIALIEGKAA